MNEEEKKLNQENQNPEETSQSRGDPRRSHRGLTKPTPEMTRNPAKGDRGPTSNENIELDDPGGSEGSPTKPTPEMTRNPAKGDRGPTSNENIELDDPE